MTFKQIRHAVMLAGIDVERSALEAQLRNSGHNIARAAAALDCSASTLRRALERHPDLLAKVGGPGRPRSTIAGKAKPQ